MTDQKRLERVIKGLMWIKHDSRLRTFRANGELYPDVVSGALALLKAQEPIKAKTMTDGNVNNPAWWCVCGNCGMEIDIGDKHCRHCGREVMLE